MKLEQGMLDILSYSFISRTKDSSIKATLRPAVDSTYNLGSDERRFATIYADTVIADTFTGSVTGNADTVDNIHASTTPTANYLLALDASLHIPNTVYHEALLVDGSRTLTGNLAVSSGITIDGVDISAHDGNINIHGDHSVISVTAGDGLTGGGTIDASRTISLDTPGTLTTSTSNSAVGNHTHEITSSSNVSSPGGVSYILEATTDGYLTLARLGVGVTPTYAIHARSTSTQMRLEYDTNNHYSIIVDNAGHFYGGSIGNQVFRRTTADTAFTATFRGNNESFITIQSNYDNSSIAQSGLQFYDYTTAKWGIWKGTSNELQIYDYTNVGYCLSISSAGEILWTPQSTGAFEIRKAGQQLRVAYDGTYYTRIETGSTGNLALLPVGTDLYFYSLVANDSMFALGGTSASNTARLRFRSASYNTDFYYHTDGHLYTYLEGNWQIQLGTDTDSTIFRVANQSWQDVITVYGNRRIDLYATVGVRLTYDATYYTFLGVSSTGVLTIDSVGDAVLLAPDNKIGSVDFTSQTEGWEMTYAGNLDCRYIYADELRVKAFTAEIYSALVGALIITKSRARLSRDFRIGIGDTAIVGVDIANDFVSISGNFVDNGAIQSGDTIRIFNSTGNDGYWTVDTVSYDTPNDETDIYFTGDLTDATVDGSVYSRLQIFLEDLEELEDIAVFDSAGGDWILLRVIDMSGGGLVVSNVWAIAYTYDQTIGDGEQSWLLHIRDAGVDSVSAGKVIYTGSIALDYGQSGDGIWEATVLDKGNSPYSQVTTWTTDPTDSANFTTWVRTGNLDGIGALTEQYGIWMGQGTDENNDAQIIMSNLGARIINTDLYVRASGTNRVIAHTDGYISAGASAPTTFGSGIGFWAGIDATYAKIMIGNTSANWLSYDSNTGYLDIKSGTNTYGRWDAGTITLGLATGTGGRAVLSSTGIYLYGNNQNTVQIQSIGDVIIGQTTGTIGNLWYDYSSSTLFMRRGSTEIIKLPATGNAQIVGTLDVISPGEITAGGGVVALNSNGIEVEAISSGSESRSYKWVGAGGTIGYFTGVYSATLCGLSLRAYLADRDNDLTMYSYANSSSYDATVSVETQHATEPAAGFSAMSSSSGSNAQLWCSAGTITVNETGLINMFSTVTISSGLHVGDSTTTPVDNVISVVSDVRVGGGLIVGSSSIDVSTGHVWFNDGNLRIYDSGGNNLRIYNSSGNYADFGADASWFNMTTNTQGFNLGAEHLYTTGTIVSGTSGVYSSYTGSVSNSIGMKKEVTNATLSVAYAGTCALYINWTGNGAASRTTHFGNGNSTYGDIHADNFVNESTLKSKINVRSLRMDVPSALDVVSRINTVAFEKENTGSKRRFGMIAEELAEILPEVVSFNSTTGKPEGIAYGQVVPLLIEAIKELQEEVRRLS